MCNYYITKDNKHKGTCTVNSVLNLRVCHFSYFTLVTEGALIIFFPRKNGRGALIGAGALNGANTV